MALSTIRTYHMLVLLSSVCLFPLFTKGLPVAIPTENTDDDARAEMLGNYFEGDILTHSAHHDSKRMIQDVPMADVGSGDDAAEEYQYTNSFSGISLWPNHTVYYKVDPEINNDLRLYFAKAIQEWSRETCLTFIALPLADTTHKAYLNLTDKFSCSSYVGQQGNMQEVSISSNCAKHGHALHEIGHSLGLFHEHTREDRDEYIRIRWENMDKLYENNFKMYSHHPATKTVPFDYQSIMLYRRDAFAKSRGLDTIEVLKEPLPDCMGTIGQRKMLSYKDALKVNKMYNCQAKIAELEERGDDCVLPTDTPTTPTPTTPTEKPCKPVKIIKSNDVISLTTTNSEGTGNMICSHSNCVKKDCTGHRSGCFSSFQRSFRVYMTKNRKNKSLKSGYEVVLRDLERNMFVDCSRHDGCRLTDCSKAPDGEITNYTNELCSVHTLELHTTSETRVSIKSTVYFKAKGEDKYLSCSTTRCKLVSEDPADCGSTSSSSVEASGLSSGTECAKRTYFKINKEETECR